MHLAADEDRVAERAQKSEADFVFNHLADERPGNPCARFRSEFVTVMPALEWTLVLHVGEVMMPFELGDACDPLRAHR